MFFFPASIFFAEKLQTSEKYFTILTTDVLQYFCEHRMYEFLTATNFATNILILSTKLLRSATTNITVFHVTFVTNGSRFLHNRILH